MLTPARPSKDDPMYQDKMEQFRLDTEDKASNPRNWGIVQGTEGGTEGGTRNDTAEPPRRGRPRKTDGI